MNVSITVVVLEMMVVLGLTEITSLVVALNMNYHVLRTD